MDGFVPREISSFRVFNSIQSECICELTGRVREDIGRKRDSLGGLKGESNGATIHSLAKVKRTDKRG